MPTIKRLLRESALPPAYLILEITESVALIDIDETMAVLEHLGNLGVGIALDDFGTGFSSLSYLARLNPRIIKIDQSFVRPVDECLRNDALLETIISIGQKLNMTMLAEGIETERAVQPTATLGLRTRTGLSVLAGRPERRGRSDGRSGLHDLSRPVASTAPV